MVWACITPNRVGPIVKIDDIMNEEYYLKIWQQNLPSAVDQMQIREEKVTFMQDNDPKHSSGLV